MDWEGNIKDKRDRIQVMLEDAELDKLVVSSAMISSIEMKVIDKII